MKRLDRLLGAILVDETEPDRESDDRQDDGGLGAVADDCREHRRADEEKQQVALELAQEHLERARTVAAQDIRPVQGEPSRRFVAGEPRRARAQPFEHVLGRDRGGAAEIERLVAARLGGGEFLLRTELTGRR